MEQGWKLVRYSFTQVNQNFRTTLWIILVPVILIAVWFAILFLIGRTYGAELQGNSVFYPFLAIVTGVLIGLALCSIAISWHRFILIGKKSAFIPIVPPRMFGHYVLKFILLITISLLVVVPATIILVATNSRGIVTNSGIWSFVFATFVSAAAYYVVLKGSLCLPAIAIGKDITIRDSWRATRGHSRIIIAVSLIIAVANQLVDQLVQVDAINSAFLTIASFYFLIMIEISILTTLYGHLIEGRPLR